MNWILKNKNTKGKALLVALFLVFGFSASFALRANAADTMTTAPLPVIPVNTNGPNSTTTSTIDSANNYTKNGAWDPETQKRVMPTKIDTSCDTLDFGCHIYKLLLGVLSFCGWIFAVAATLFAWVVAPENISGTTGILNKQAVKDVWVMVRDVLNMTFILILLFASFCTIFQVEKWNLKKVWLNILINALLVNFSFPIARFFIDVSNVAMYYFINHLFTSMTTVDGSVIMSKYANLSGISTLLSPGDYSSEAIPYLIASIVFVFIFGVTLLVVAALFLVRLIALTMIVMFSPIGFVGFIFPETKSYAEKWWNSLFSYSFFAPIMIFIMMISLKILEAVRNENFQSALSNGGINTINASQASWVANAALYLIPIIILWMGMGVAKSMGIEGADKIVGKAQDWSKSFGQWVGGMPMRGVKYGWKQSGIPGGVKKGYKEARKSGKIFGFENDFTKFALKDGREGREAGISGVMGERSKGWTDARNRRRTDENKEKIEKGAKSIVDGGATVDSLAQDINGHFATPATTYDDKIKHARHAAAYLKQDHEERKMHIKASLQSAGGIGGSDLQHILNAAMPTGLSVTQQAIFAKQKADATAAATAIAGGSNNEKHLKSVAAFVNRQMKSQIKNGADATA